MLKKERADFILTRLNELYPETPVPLDHKNNFTLLVAVLLSAQCTDERVNKVTPSLFKLADNPYDMQHIPVEKIYKVVRPCGLAPQKSSAISKLSAILVEQFGGQVPNDFASLESLPGVGHKTAGVVMSQGFGFPAFPVDTHIHRLAQGPFSVFLVTVPLQPMHVIPLLADGQDIQNGHTVQIVLCRRKFGSKRSPIPSYWHIKRISSLIGLNLS